MSLSAKTMQNILPSSQPAFIDSSFSVKQSKKQMLGVAHMKETSVKRIRCKSFSHS